MNIFTSTTLIDKIKFNNNLFTKIIDGNVLMYKGSMKDYMQEKATHDIIEMFRAHHFLDRGDFYQYQNKILSLIFNKDEVHETLDMSYVD